MSQTEDKYTKHSFDFWVEYFMAVYCHYDQIYPFSFESIKLQLKIHNFSRVLNHFNSVKSRSNCRSCKLSCTWFIWCFVVNSCLVEKKSRLEQLILHSRNLKRRIFPWFITSSYFSYCNCLGPLVCH